MAQPRNDHRGSRRSWKRCLGRLKSYPLSHRWMQLMDRCALALSRRARQSAPTTCSSRPTLALGYTIITDNEKEFARVEDLQLQNWLR
jgi:hypothetical protein